MFRPYIKRTSILVLIAFFNIFLVYIAHTSSKFIPDKNYDLKVKASNIMKDALLYTNAEFKKSFNDTLSLELDFFESGLIGVDSIYSSMTTKEGIFESKTAVTNPDFSALYIDYFSKIDDSLGLSLTDISSQDTIAVHMTGSFPGANVALLAACKASNIYPIIISSIGSSSWGANRLNMTWIDIENILYGQIFNYKSVMVSLGGDNDTADELSENTKLILTKKIKNYGYPLVYNQDLKESINIKMNTYNRISQDYKVYISIGGSASSLGNELLSQFFSPGLNFHKDEDVNIDVEIVESNTSYDLSLEPIIHQFNDNDIPIINIKNINKLCMENDLPYWELDQYANYTSLLFGEVVKYPPLTIWLCFIASFLVLFWVVISSINQVNKKMEEIENDTVI